MKLDIYKKAKKYNIRLTQIALLSLYFPGVVTVGEMVRNKTAFIADVQQHMKFDPAALQLLLESAVPNNNLVVSQRHPQCVYSVQANI